MHNLIKASISILFLLFSQFTLAQSVCEGALGDPVININFGSGATDFGPALGSAFTTYRFLQGTPEDGEYAIAKNTYGMHNQIDNGWHQISNHTPGDADGYMMLVNASDNPGTFYQTNISGLCPETTYEFAAWIINILNYSGRKPNITFTIETSTGDILQRYVTGDIPDGTKIEWIKYATLFKTTDQTDLVLKISNSGPGGVGNDIALDDITFRACGPVITPSIDGASPNINVCEGNSGNYKLAANVLSGYSNPVYKWQRNINGVWVDIAGEVSTQTTANLTNAPSGTYQYRLMAAEKQNINSVNCRVVSEPLTINILAKPNTLASNNGPLCAGANAQLTATEGTIFSWSGPNGFSSTEQSPVINDAQVNMSGVYTVTATSNGCSTTSSTTLSIFEPIKIETNVTKAITCENNPVQLTASGGTTYKWFPAEGLSSANIANPIANPSSTTKYTVTVSNGGCSATADVEVVIIKNAVADAGTDLKALNGQSVTLYGKVTGDNVTYFWTPTAYLDDPTKLNPKASPPFDITYTLNAISNSGCVSSADEVFVKIYPKIVIPNAFSPNGDGFNDTWNIPAASAFNNAELRVVNRNGNLVYQSRGIYKPWDGKFNGKDLPVGTYYYTIYFNQDFETYSGWVLLTR